MAVDAGERVALDQQVSQSSVTDQHKCVSSQTHLLTLPAEILREILRPLLKSDVPLSRLEKKLRIAEDGQAARPFASPSFGRWSYYPTTSLNLHPQILRVCRHLHNAGWTILYKQNIWVFYIFHGPGRRVAYLHPDLAQGGKIVRTVSPFGDDDQDTKGPPESVRKHMGSFAFDVQLEALTYRKYSTESDYFYQLSGVARKMLTGEEKALFLTISTAPQLLTSTNSKMGNPIVVDVLDYFAPFKGIRCGFMDVEVNVVLPDTELADVITSEDPVEHELPSMLAEFHVQVKPWSAIPGFPRDLERRLIHAMVAWNAGEFRSVREEILEAVDDLLEKKRLDFKRYRDSL